MDKTKESDSKSISEQERREKIRQGLLHKKECEAKALSIVEALLLETVEKEKFREAGMFLNESYYNDLVDERSCSNLCGYALCNKTLEHVVKHQYHISTKHNKVFDITERKKFCSNLCFKSSNFYKDQLLSSPLWLRESKDIAPIRFYEEVSVTTQRRGQGYGDEIVLQSTKDADERTQLSNTSPNIPKTTKISFKLDDSCDDITTKFSNLEIPKLDSSSSNNQVHDNRDKNDAKESPNVNLKGKTTGILVNNKSEPKQTTSSTEQPRDTHKRKDAKSSTGKRSVEKESSKDRSTKETTPLIKVEQCVSEWYTIDTLRLTKGDDFVREVLRENGCTVSKMVAAVGVPDVEGGKLTSEFRERYIQLCRRLELQDLEDSTWDYKEINNCVDGQDDGTEKVDRNNSKKPLPSYDELRQTVEVETLKVGSYFKGKTECEIVERTKTKKDCDSAEDTVKPILPLIDRHAQGALRRRIVNEQLDRELPDILQLIGISRQEIDESLRKLVLSFEFSATNIVLRPQEWTLVSVILLKMISIREENIQKIWNSAEAKKCLNMILFGCGTDIKCIDAKVENMHSDIHTLISKMKPMS